MAIQNRRGPYENFDPQKMLPGEWAVVTSGDSKSVDGTSVYMCFAAGNVKRMATYEDMTQNIREASGEAIEDQISEKIDGALEKIESAIQGADTAKTAANDAAANAERKTSEAEGAIAELNAAITDTRTVIQETNAAKQEALDAAERVHQVLDNGIIDLIYPVGSIYLSTNPANPSRLFGGNWEQWGTGCVPVGVDTAQEEFNQVEKTGGEKTHALTESEMPTHTHGIPELTGSTMSTGTHSHQMYYRNDNQIGGNADRMGTSTTNNGTRSSIASGGGHDHTIKINESVTEETGSGNVHNNLQPYITCYMWKRVA